MLLPNGGRRSACRVAALGLFALNPALLLTACPRDDPDRRGEAEQAHGGAADSATAAVDATGIAPADPRAADGTDTTPDHPRAAVRPAEPPIITAAADSAGKATPQELEELAAVLQVPVAGVQRSDLRDTFTEARGDRVHEALDIAAPRGTPVLSAADGRLLRMFNSRPGGLMVYATDASERFILLYGHLDSYAAGLRDGMQLERGQVIGYVGTTGNAAPDAPHLHFGILRGQPTVSWSTGVAVNPYLLLAGQR